MMCQFLCLWQSHAEATPSNFRNSRAIQDLYQLVYLSEVALQYPNYLITRHTKLVGPCRHHACSNWFLMVSSDPPVPAHFLLCQRAMRTLFIPPYDLRPSCVHHALSRFDMLGGCAAQNIKTHGDGLSNENDFSPF
ncbi:unnamed protein product [Cyberlindnera jadinii]|uniref:Uncharacterized protein n=1 Tax=Cyberlindnera jadinii (strain ATCC 18201 / CBS 1600 / BCRC 20928 / JCM 3617 / NBRC 0987 / NRRL Y-1542) TaxID=983966 RepID=A0A0H5C618_CYBJN|nr:unnamed protein product [Cyberlindnera jadinii]